MELPQWQELLAIAGLLGAISVPIVWVWRDHRASIHDLHKRIDAQNVEHDKRIDAQNVRNELLTQTTNVRIEMLKDSLANYQLEAARTFAGHDTIARVEKRLIASEERMAASFDKLVDRIDRLAELAHGKRPSPN